MKIQAIGQIAVALVIAGGTHAILAQQSSPEAEEARRTRGAARARLELARSATLPEAARAAGGTYVSEQPWQTWQSVVDLADLYRESDVVAVGEVRDAAPTLSPDRKTVSTMVSISVSESLKGTPAKNDELLVWTPGGRVKLDDGLVVDVRVKDWQPLAVGQRCVLFLSAMKPTAQASEVGRLNGVVLKPTAGRQGVFVLTGSRIESRSRLTDPLKQRYTQADLAAFMRELRSLAKG